MGKTLIFCLSISLITFCRQLWQTALGQVEATCSLYSLAFSTRLRHESGSPNDCHTMTRRQVMEDLLMVSSGSGELHDLFTWRTGISPEHSHESCINNIKVVLNLEGSKLFSHPPSPPLSNLFGGFWVWLRLPKRLSRPYGSLYEEANEDRCIPWIQFRCVYSGVRSSRMIHAAHGG